MLVVNKIRDKLKITANSLKPEGKADYVLIDVDAIKKGTPFKQLFPIKPDVLATITKDMELNGYDNSQPVIIWKETNLLIDGHTRSKAAKEANINRVPAVYYSFPDVDSALKYAYGLQFKRRNIDDSDRFSFAEQYLNNIVQGSKKSGWKKQELAEILTVSMTTAQKFLSVINRATDKDKEAVKSGAITINTAYKKLLSKEGGKKSKSSNVNNTTVSNMDKNSLIYIDTDSVKKRVDMWAKTKAYHDRIIAISEILPRESEIAKYVKGLLGKEREDVSL